MWLRGVVVLVAVVAAASAEEETNLQDVDFEDFEGGCWTRGAVRGVLVEWWRKVNMARV